MNRVLLAGTLSAAEQLGRDPAQPFVLAHLEDPTGTVSVTAGGFHPHALAQLTATPAGTAAIVVGKAHLYRGRDGGATPSVRAERVRAVGAEELRLFLLDAVEQTLVRLVGSSSAPVPTGGTEAPPSGSSTAKPDFLRNPEDAAKSIRGGLERVLEFARSTPAQSAERGGTVRVVRSVPPPSPPPPSDDDRVRSSVLLEIVDELSDGSADGYADLRELLRLAEGRGIPTSRTEELLRQLEERGSVEEPIVGKLRRAT